MTAPLIPATPPWQQRALPIDAAPTIPADHDIILYIHGGPGSRLEESIDLVPELHSVGLAMGKKYTVIAFDHPNNGYSTAFDHTAIAPDSATHMDPVSGTPTYPILDWMENFIIAFIDRLDQIVPVKDRLAGIVGGSLGGCLTLRLARRTDQPWIRRTVAWDPSSAWTSWNDDVAKFVALGQGRDRWEADPPPQQEDPTQRDGYFKDAFGPAGPFSKLTNPQMWYRDNWPCKTAYINAALLDQQEVYTQSYRRWHWRLGTELLLFSHRNTDTVDHRPRYDTILVPTLLGAGALDNYDASPGLQWLNIYPRTVELAGLMQFTPGATMFLLDTGHSIHNERPHYLATRIVTFVGTPASDLHAPLQVTPASTPPDEPVTCTARQSPIDDGSGSAVPPAALLVTPVDSPYDQGRLIDGLRSAAASHDAVGTLVRAAVTLYFSTPPATPPRVIDGLPATAQGATALADLAVTGRQAYDVFCSTAPNDATIVAPARAQVASIEVPDETKLAASVKAVLDRTYQVAWALRDPNPTTRAQTRATLGWIAVSSEDDLPHRPVNAGSALFPQFTLPVTNQGVTVDLRFMIASVNA